MKLLIIQNIQRKLTDLNSNCYFEYPLSFNQIGRDSVLHRKTNRETVLIESIHFDKVVAVTYRNEQKVKKEFIPFKHLTELQLREIDIKLIQFYKDCMNTQIKEFLNDFLQYN